MTTDDPTGGRSTFRIAPAPVAIPHDSGPSTSTGASLGTGTSADAEHTEYDANEDWPKKWLCSGSPDARRSVVDPSSREPPATSGPSERQYRGCPSRQLRHAPQNGQPITTFCPGDTFVTPAPIARTTPAPSCPTTPGVGNGKSPSRARASVWQTPDATICTSASPGRRSSSMSTSPTENRACSFSKIAAVARTCVVPLRRYAAATAAR